jgi:hypothetical protein
MLAQWKSDGFITRKCLDRNEDMYDFFGLIHVAILSSGRIELCLGSSLSYQSMLAQWKSDGFKTRKYLDQNEDMYDFLSHSYIVRRKDRTLIRILYFIKAC